MVAACGRIVPSDSTGARAWQKYPRVTLWAWETPEDLRHLAVANYAVAYLDRTIFIADRVSTLPRRQPLLLSGNASVMAVVRIEAVPERAQLHSPDLPARVAELVVEAARRSNASSLQIDFDAARSQLPFYRNLIEETRRRMPAGMPLSITALASWCAQPGWMQDLPVDEAVPMLFRMGRSRQAVRRSGWTYR